MRNWKLIQIYFGFQSFHTRVNCGHFQVEKDLSMCNNRSPHVDYGLEQHWIKFPNWAHKGPLKDMDLLTTLESILENSFNFTAVYKAPTESDLTLAQELFESILKNKEFTSAEMDKCKTLGLKCFEVKEGNELYGVISEHKSQNGHGLYIFRLLDPSRKKSSPETGGDLGFILQAPHKPTDLFTDKIILHLFLHSKKFSASAWSTTSRGVVDLCKEPNSYFNSFTRAVALAASSPKLLQLHGYNKANHNTSADLIFSSTKPQLPSKFLPFSTALKKGLGVTTVVNFPSEFPGLGGLLNVNAKTLYATNPNSMFFHIETSKELREELKVDHSLRKKFASCFLNTL